jgi:hypothetical protein
MKIYYYILIASLTYLNLTVAETEIRITSGTSLFVPAEARICAENIVVLSGGSYITEIPEGTCAEANISGDGIIILPVELISFTGEWTGKAVVLNWSTATEIDNFGFTIMKSTDQENWKEIGFIKGNGNSTSPKHYEYIDNSPFESKKLYYRLKQNDINGNSELSDIIEIDVEILSNELFQNYPNPFNPSTKIRFSIPERDQSEDATKQLVTLRVFDLLGREVATLVNEERPPGIYEIEFSVNSRLYDKLGFLTSGIYFYKLETGNFSQIKKMILIK